jgi:hypothetical protein
MVPANRTAVAASARSWAIVVASTSSGGAESEWIAAREAAAVLSWASATLSEKAAISPTGANQGGHRPAGSLGEASLLSAAPP